MPDSQLRITSVPPGEAPLWVREKWVGLSLPLAQRKAQARSLFTSGVLSGPRGFFASIGALLAGKLQRRSGFVVETQAAIAVLATSSPEAAAWGKRTRPTCCGQSATSCSRKMLVMSARLDLGPDRARYLSARPLHSIVLLL